MSFILDALKKSETERQQQGKAEFSSVPTSSDEPNPARWLWLLAALLVVNFAVLIGILLKPGTSPEPQALPAPPAAAPALQVSPSVPAAAASFAAQVADAVEQRPVASTAVSTAPEPTQTQTPTSTTTTGAAQAPAAATYVPTLDELRLKGSLTLPDLHLDIHVYSEDPASRFVFINMSKYHEGSRIAAGPQVREITPDGVILDDQGQAFLLPRE